MKTNELIELYAKARTALFITVPVAAWGFTYWLSGGEMLASFLIGFGLMLPLFDVLPSKSEVKHRLLAERKRQENIWFKMI